MTRAQAVPLAIAAAVVLTPFLPPTSVRTCLVSQQVHATSPAIHEFSGLKVIHAESGASDIVALRLYLLGGNRQHAPENAGVEALLLTTMKLEARDAFRATGSHETVEVTPDWSVTGFVALRRDFDAVWKGFVSPLLEPRLSDDDINLARRQLTMRIRRERTRPEDRLASGALRFAFRGHPYGISPLGTSNTLGVLTRADLKRYHQEQFVTSRMLLVVVGALGADEVQSLVAESLGRLPVGDYEWTVPSALPDREAGWAIEHQLLPTSHIVGYFDGPSPADPDYFPFLVSVAVVSGSIAQRVREEEALSYAAYASVLHYGRPIGGIYVSSARPGEAMRQIRDVLGDISEYFITTNRSMAPPPPSWRRYLEQLALRELLRWSSSDGQAASLARSYLYFERLETPREYNRRFVRVDYTTVARMVRRYMRGIQWAFMGDTALMRGRW